MKITVVCNDGKRHIFKGQPPELKEEMSVNVINGLGFAISEGENILAYGPGMVARVLFVLEKEDVRKV